MRYRTVLRPTDQLALFRPKSTMPLWRDLPAQIQTQTVQLLSRLLRQHRERLHAERAGEAVRDE